MELSAKNGLGIRFVWDWGREPKWLVECEIEVLYQILAWGVLKKMKNNPHGIKPAKVQKAGLHTFALFVKSYPAWADSCYTATHSIHTVLLYSLVLYIAL